MLTSPDTPDLLPSAPDPASNGHPVPRNGQPSGIAGRYTYRRVFHDERLLELLPDGTIGDGLGRAETHWTIQSHATGDILQIAGDHGVICELRRDPDDVWRGRWSAFERMPIELYPLQAPIPPMPEFNSAITVDDGRFHFVSYVQFLADVKSLAQQLPPLRGVVGNPRSGIFPAAIIAASQNIPLLSLDEVLFSDRPHIPELRRRPRGELPDQNPILIVDDTVYSGQQFAYLQSRVKLPVLWAGVYVDQSALQRVDFYHAIHCRVAQTYEWTLLHDFNCPRMVCDLDGVLCEDWHGDEERDPHLYLDHVENARPLRIPSQPIMAVVTGRLEQYREQTARWLARHGVRYSYLHMFPGMTVAARSQYGAAAYKAGYFEMHGQALAFIESCPAQAQCIHGITGRPVLDFTSMQLHTRDVIVQTPRPRPPRSQTSRSPAPRSHALRWNAPTDAPLRVDNASTAPPPYDFAPYAHCWQEPGWSVDRRHVAWIYDLLASGRFTAGLEIGCWHGATSSAFVEALNQNALQHATFCDVEVKPTLLQTLGRRQVSDRVRIYAGRSADLLQESVPYDFVLVDGDHRLETVREEIDLLLRTTPLCIMAHDTNSTVAGHPSCEGPAYLKWRLQTTAPYLCLEDNFVRPGEATARGMFLATTSPEILELARASLARRGDFNHPVLTL